MKNSNLHKAKAAKNDEFYTMLPDIEKELQHYEHHFKDKIVYCNCDSPESNFVKYFEQNKERLGVSDFINTWYNKETGEVDFRSEIAIEILQVADIIVTNPPFSLFREFIALMEKYEKKYLIVGNMNAITYKETFKLIKDNKLWLGVTYPKEFQLPDTTIQKFGNISWFTNLHHNKRNEPLQLSKTYNPIDYPKYDNYDAIEVSKTVDIPIDYQGVMGVPISFLTKYNPDQFEIIDANSVKSEATPYKESGLVKDKDSAINGKPTYVRILIRHKQPKQ